MNKNFIDIHNRFTHKYTIDAFQLNLLHFRPFIEPVGQIKKSIPKDVLISAKYGSIGSFGFFMRNKKEADFCFFSAQNLIPIRQVKSKNEKVSFYIFLNNQHDRNIKFKRKFHDLFFSSIRYEQFFSSNGDELFFSSNLDNFLFHLFSGNVGSPIESRNQDLIAGIIQSFSDENLSDEKSAVIKNLKKQLDSNKKNDPINNICTLIIDTSAFQEN